MSEKKIINTIKDKRNKTFLISTHMRPDVDALSSELAMAVYLRSCGKNVHIINGDKSADMYHAIPGIGRIKQKTKKKVPYDIAIVVDCGELNRIGDVRDLLEKGKPLINIDHHITNDRFGDLNLVKTRASSTAEIIYGLLKQARVRLNSTLAKLLYLGIMTDTGSFRYDNTTQETHQVVSDLMKFRFSVNQIYTDIYENISISNIKLFSQIANRFKTAYKGKIVYIELNREFLNQCAHEFDLRDKLFSYLRQIKGVEVVVIFTPRNKTLTRINLRSQGRVNVAKLASQFQGGGHVRASGCTISKPLKEARRQLFRELGRLLNRK